MLHPRDLCVNAFGVLQHVCAGDIVPVMTQVSDYRGLGLRPLPPETWGKRLARARTNAQLNLRDVEERLAPYISRATLNRLEALDIVPARRQDRGRAFLVLILYGYDPADFGLGPDDRPPATDLRALSKLRSARPGWMRGTAGRALAGLDALRQTVEYAVWAQ
jgi:hypothetical protein